MKHKHSGGMNYHTPQKAAVEAKTMHSHAAHCDMGKGSGTGTESGIASVAARGGHQSSDMHSRSSSGHGKSSVGISKSHY
jgi:hypothetical protein